MRSSIWLAIFVIFVTFNYSNSFTVECGLRTVSLSIGNVYECFITNVPTSQGKVVTNVFAFHTGSANDFSVTSVAIYGNNTLTFVPTGFSKVFPNIKAVRVFNADLKTLNGDELREFGHLLLYVSIEFSNLKVISSNLFQNTRNVNYVVFPNNEIEEVGFKFFALLNVTNMRYIDFRNNTCINRFATTASNVRALMQELRTNCPYEDEDLCSNENPNDGSLSCDRRSNDDLTCDLKSKVNDWQNKFETVMNPFEERVKWLEDEVAKLKSNPCTCN